MSLSIYQVDAFTDVVFAGNPAAVCILDGFPRVDASWMRDLASEMNLSETAFLRRRPEEEPTDTGRSAIAYDLRWFTPEVEVDLCGHATLASAHSLWESSRVPSGTPIRFHSKSGPLDVHPTEANAIAMDFPSESWEHVEDPELRDQVRRALPTIEPNTISKTRFDVVVELDDEATLRDLRPDPAQLAEIETRGVIVTALAERNREQGGSYDFVSRFFAPRCGVLEDPVTGSAHCCLGPYWFGRLGRTSAVGYQASIRGGLVRVEAGDREGRVTLTGRAVTVFQALLSPRVWPRSDGDLGRV